MNGPEITRRDDGSVVISHLAPAFVHVLHELPTLLDPNQPDAVKERLFPLPSDEDEMNRDWARLVHPELFALLASARDIVDRDLASLRPADDESVFRAYQLTIADGHIPGWLSALNAARLTLGTLHDLDETDMNDDTLPEDWNERQIAVAKVHLLGWLQQLILEDEHPTPDDAFGDEAEE